MNRKLSKMIIALMLSKKNERNRSNDPGEWEKFDEGDVQYW